jgi:hypothetical protein
MEFNVNGNIERATPNKMMNGIRIKSIYCKTSNSKNRVSLLTIICKNNKKATKAIYKFDHSAGNSTNK